MISRWVAGVAILFGILLLMLPSRDQQSLSRIASASMLMCSKAFREQVAQQLLRGETVRASFNNTCPDQIGSLQMSDNGEMVIRGKHYPVTMTLSPVVSAGTIHWSCHGEPQGAVTKLCKP